jgi:hypothetical protein
MESMCEHTTCSVCISNPNRLWTCHTQHWTDITLYYASEQNSSYIMKRKICKFKIYSIFSLCVIMFWLLFYWCRYFVTCCVHVWKGGNVRDYTDLVVVFVFTVFLNYKKIYKFNINEYLIEKIITKGYTR